MKIRILWFLATLAGSACGGDDAAPADTSDDASCAATIDLLDYKLDPKDIEATSGKVTLCAVNKGMSTHDLGVRDGSKKTLGITKALAPGDEDRFTVELSAATYDI